MAANYYTVMVASPAADIVTVATNVAGGSSNDGSPNGLSPEAWFVDGGQVSHLSAPLKRPLSRALRVALRAEGCDQRHEEVTHRAKERHENNFRMMNRRITLRRVNSYRVPLIVTVYISPFVRES